MTEYITYKNYTEFLLPNTDYKAVIYNDGSGRLENMADRDGGIVFSNDDTDTLCTKLDEAEVTIETLKAIIAIKAMNINIPELFKVFTEANVQSACPLVECCVEEYPTEAVISYNCRHRCGAEPSSCCYCTFYR